MNVCGTTATDDAFLYGCSGSCQRIFQAKLSFLHLSLGSSTYTDDCHATGQLSQSLLQLLSVEIRSGLFDLLLDLCDSGLQCFLIAFTVYDHGVLFLYLNGFCTTQHIHCGILQLITKLGTDYGTAGQNCDILQHSFSSVTIAGSLNSYYIESTTQLVDDQGGQRLALYILSDDQQLSAGLNDLL